MGRSLVRKDDTEGGSIIPEEAVQSELPKFMSNVARMKDKKEGNITDLKMQRKISMKKCVD